MTRLIFLLLIHYVSAKSDCGCLKTIEEYEMCETIDAVNCSFSCTQRTLFQLSNLVRFSAVQCLFESCAKIEISATSINLVNVAVQGPNSQFYTLFNATSTLALSSSINYKGGQLILLGGGINISEATITTQLFSLFSNSDILISNSTFLIDNQQCTQDRNLIDFITLQLDQLQPKLVFNQSLLQSRTFVNISVEQMRERRHYSLLVISQGSVNLDASTKINATRIGVFSKNIYLFGSISVIPDCSANMGIGRGPKFFMENVNCSLSGGASAGQGGIGAIQSTSLQDECYRLYQSARQFIQSVPYNDEGFIGSGSGSAGLNSGPSGGGYVRLHAEENVQIFGSIIADGTHASDANGGGGGGAISVKAMNLSGAGKLSVRGGDSDSTGLAGEGGGGVVLLLAYGSQTSSFTVDVSNGNRKFLNNSFLGSGGTIRLLPCPYNQTLDTNTLQCVACPANSYNFGNRGICTPCPGVPSGVTGAACTQQECIGYSCNPFRLITDSIYTIEGGVSLGMFLIIVIAGYFIRRAYQHKESPYEKLPFDFETATRYMTIDHLFTEELMHNDNFQLVDLMYHAHRISITGNNSYHFPWHLQIQPPQEIQYLIDHDAYRKFAQKLNYLAEWTNKERMTLHFLQILYYPLYWWFLVKLKKKKYFAIESFFYHQEIRFLKNLEDYTTKLKLSKSADYTILYLDIFNYKWSDLKYFLLACPYYIQLSGEGTFLRPLYLCESNPFLTCLYFSINRNIDRDLDDERYKILENLVHHKKRMENSQKLNRFIIKFNRFARAIDLESPCIVDDVKRLLQFMHISNEKFFISHDMKVNLFVIYNDEFTILENYDSPYFKSFLSMVKNKNIRFGLFIYDPEADLEEVDNVLDEQRISFDDAHNPPLLEPTNAELTMEDLKERYIERQRQLQIIKSEASITSSFADSTQNEKEKSSCDKWIGLIRSFLMTHQISTMSKQVIIIFEIVMAIADAMFFILLLLNTKMNIASGNHVLTQLQVYFIPFPLSIPVSEALGCFWIFSQSYGIARTYLITLVLSVFNLAIFLITSMNQKLEFELLIPLLDLLVKLLLVHNTKRVLSLNIKLNKLNQLKHIIQ